MNHIRDVEYVRQEGEEADDGYIRLSIAVCTEIAKVVVSDVKPTNITDYQNTRRLFLKGCHERWFLYSNLMHIYEELKRVFKVCETLQAAHRYMQKNYGYNFNKKLSAKEKVCLENIKEIKRMQHRYRKTDREVAEKIGVDRLTLLRFKQKYKGGMWNE